MTKTEAVQLIEMPLRQLLNERGHRVSSMDYEDPKTIPWGTGLKLHVGAEDEAGNMLNFVVAIDSSCLWITFSENNSTNIVRKKFLLPDEMLDFIQKQLLCR